ncbi:Tyrosinase [Arthrobotrys entomopaga]|nr:Tyrosinase [Arthrobotrys entomopaga]
MAGWSSLKCALVAASILSAGVQSTPYGYDHSGDRAAHLNTPRAVKSNVLLSAAGSGNQQPLGHYDPTSLNDTRVPRNVTGPMFVTGIQQGFSQGGQVPIRKEIREMIKNETEFSLFVMALYRLQQQPQELDNSYYAIAGIHGQPAKPWDNVKSVPNADLDRGYCGHFDMLFLPWHRPYLALFEQQIWNHAYDIVKELPNGPKKDKFKAVLPTLRLPYWDWANNAEIPEEVSQMNMIPIETVRHDRESIQNPLFSYFFTDTKELQGYLWGNQTETVRFPGTSKDGSLKSQIRKISASLKAQETNWRNKVYKLLVNYKDFTQMARGGFDPANPQEYGSLEEVHGAVHMAVGKSYDGGEIPGTMAPIDYSGFDPIFWLHHANIDRQFAMWQNMNPDKYTFGPSPSGGTYARAIGEPVDINTPLKPFRKSTNEFWTGASVKDTKTFGYTYAETIGTSKDTLIKINQLYGVKTPAFILKNTKDNTPTNRVKRGVDTKPDLAPVKEKIIKDNNKYIDWTANIKVSHAALNGSFSIYMFFGEPANSTISSDWAADENFVGTYGIFSGIKSKDMIVSGTIPLTSAIMAKIAAKEIDTNNPSAVVPYLLKNLKTKAAAINGNKVTNIKDLKDLKIQITATEVTLPASLEDVPKYGKAENKIDLIDVAAGKLGPVVDAAKNATIKGRSNLEALRRAVDLTNF